MDIPKKGSYRTSFTSYLGLILAITVGTGGISPADTGRAVETLIATYRLPDAMAPSEAESAIDTLKRALDACEDSYLAFRIRYRIGVIYFKAGMIGASEAEFRLIADDPKCPELIRACSLNMTGQISRLSGEHGEALEAFDKLASILKRRLSSDNERASKSAMVKLCCSAVLSRAEIYDLQRNYAAGIAEYGRLLGLLNQIEDRDMSNRYAPLANDRMSQLYLCRGNIDKYTQLANALTVSYPEYARTPMISLESACVEFLSNISTKTEFPLGSFDAPARVIASVKSSNVKIPVQSIVNKLSSLSRKYKDTEGGILLLYHYAWLLDTTGEKDKAAKIFARISHNDGANASDGAREKAVTRSIQEYATIQYAIMAGEKANYREALRALSGLRNLPDKSHALKLVESVTKGIQTLRREVPRNDNEKR
jgi:tetratricopeptide (TPR) repeat protein